MNLVDRVVSFFSPAKGVERAIHRQSLAQLTGYEAADRGNQYNRERKNTGGKGDEHIDEPSLFELRESSRDLDRNNGLSSSILDRCVENVIGPCGFRLKPQTGDHDLNKRIAEDWWDWTPKADYRQEFQFWQLMNKAYLSQLRDGDFWAQKIDKSLHVNFFEADRVLNPTGAVAINGMDLVHGVARDKAGVKRWLWVANDIPKYGMARPEDGQALRAEQFDQLYNPRRLTLTRGLPICTPIIREFDDIDDLLLCNRIGAKLQAAQTFNVQTSEPAKAADFMRDQYNSASSEKRIEKVEPGGVTYTRPGEEMKSIESTKPGPNFTEFMTLLNRFLGLPVGLPLELVLLDFSKVNFASSRQLLNQAQRRFRIEQFNIGWFVSKLYVWWLARRVAQGVYKVPDESLPKLYKHAWGFPGWPSPNPIQDVMAAVLAIENGLGSRTGFADNHGDDIDEIFDELQAENKGLDSRTLTLMAMLKIQAQAKAENKLLETLQGQALTADDPALSREGEQ